MKIELSEQTLSLVRTDAGKGCFLCKRILQSMRDGEIHDWPPGSSGNEVEFPKTGQRDHILLLMGRIPE